MALCGGCGTGSVMSWCFQTVFWSAGAEGVWRCDFRPGRLDGWGWSVGVRSKLMGMARRWDVVVRETARLFSSAHYTQGGNGAGFCYAFTYR
jgi:hypothetical protein